MHKRFTLNSLDFFERKELGMDYNTVDFHDLEERTHLCPHLTLSPLEISLDYESVEDIIKKSDLTYQQDEGEELKEF